MIIHYNNTHEKECKNLSTFQLKTNAELFFLRTRFKINYCFTRPLCCKLYVFSFPPTLNTFSLFVFLIKQRCNFLNLCVLSECGHYQRYPSRGSPSDWVDNCGLGLASRGKKTQNKTWVSKDELTHYCCYKKSVLQYLMLFLDTDMAHLERCRPG